MAAAHRHNLAAIMLHEELRRSRPARRAQQSARPGAARSSRPSCARASSPTWTGATCAVGLCACPAGEVVCGSACADLAGDEAHCGACGNVCGLGFCSGGSCTCAPGTSECGGRCADHCPTLLAAVDADPITAHLEGQDASLEPPRLNGRARQQTAHGRVIAEGPFQDINAASALGAMAPRATTMTNTIAIERK